MSRVKNHPDFWENVEKTDTCWLWTGSQNYDGYGNFYGKRTHRLAYELTYGRIPKGFYICHTCDRPRCVKPEHLFLGSPSDNSIDAEKKGRRVHIVINSEAKKRYKKPRIKALIDANVRHQRKHLTNN